MLQWLNLNGFEDFHKSFYNNGFTGKEIFRVDIMSFQTVIKATEARCKELQQHIALLQKKPPIIVKGAAEQPYKNRLSPKSSVSATPTKVAAQQQAATTKPATAAAAKPPPSNGPKEDYVNAAVFAPPPPKRLSSFRALITNSLL